ncbi:MAG: serine/threonine-protein kinase [Myxococcota bacterium]|nr:serine/threonine-protein kinase [Myxococcota bacterium]
MSSNSDSAQTLAGKYVINRPIGSGSFAKVYEATDLKVGRRVAIKVLSNRFGQVIERFAREIALIKDLEHPNITRLYDFDTTPDGAPFMVMEFVEGVELGALVSREGRLPIKRTIALAMQIVDALAEAHGQGIVHCDLKPENILVCAKGARQDVVQILDFGISAITAEVQQGDSSKPELVGTPSYMAPEQIRQENLGPWTDIYALGLIIIEMMEGSRVFDGGTPHEILRRQLKEDVVIPEIVKQSPLMRIVERAVAKDFRQRFQTAREVYLALEEANAQLLAAMSSGSLQKSPELEFDPFAAKKDNLELENPDPISYSLSVGADGSISALSQTKLSSVESPKRGRLPEPRQRTAGSAAERPRPPKPEPVDTKPFKLELDPEAVQRINESRRRIQVYQEKPPKSRFGLWLLLITVVIAVAAGVVYWHQFMRGQEESTADAPPAPKHEEPAKTTPTKPATADKPKSGVAFDSTNLSRLVRASTATAASGIGGERLPIFKLIVSPFDAQTYAGPRRLCTRTPCRVALLGTKALVSVQAAKFNEHRLELLAADAEDREKTLMIELEAQ